MARNELCPLCRKSAERVLQLRFRAKMKLPSEPIIRFCAADNFLFVAAGSQQNYDEYYATVINDSYHAEMGGAHARSPIVIEQKRQFLRQLPQFLEQSRNVLDFGCGEASLLLELAADYPQSVFWGFDASPAATIGRQNLLRMV